MHEGTRHLNKLKHQARFLLLGLLLLPFALRAESGPPQQIAPGVWFTVGDSGKGYSNTAVIEMRDYLIVADAHGNPGWTAAGATTMAFHGVTDEMNRWEPTRWRNALPKRPDLQATGDNDVQRPQMSISGDKLVLNDGKREVDFLFFGWGHTPGDGYVWLPAERILATGDAAVNGPRNKLLDANLANWPKALDKAIALAPLHVLPGHGDAGGIEILQGQQRFLVDLYAAVKAQVDAGKKPTEMHIELPEPDNYWFPAARGGLHQQDVETVYLEITSHAPAGSVPHEWR